MKNHILNFKSNFQMDKNFATTPIYYPSANHTWVAYSSIIADFLQDLKSMVIKFIF